MAYYKPQSPIKNGEDYIYPLTTVDQVMLDDGSRLNAKYVTVNLDNAEDGGDVNTALVNADSLGGKPASDYALKADAVFSVNGIDPDENGNIELGDIGSVKTIDNIEPDENGNIQLNAAKVDNYITTMTAEDFEALTIEQKAELYSQGVRVITVNGDLDSDNLSDMQRFAQFVYPVGSIVELTVATNPATLWGFGTWESVKDRFLIGAGGSYSVGSTGGEAMHTLTVDEMPMHSHYERMAVDNVGTEYYITATGSGSEYTETSVVASGATRTGREYQKTDTEGGSQSHNNMPPYLAVYMWKRTA